MQFSLVMFDSNTLFHHLNFAPEELQKQFNYPFFYQPNELVKRAANEVQLYLENQFDLAHNFGLGLHDDLMVIGKMFGVLLVEYKGEVGYLAGFSGKLAGVNHVPGFVGPIYDMLKIDSYFLQEEEKINALNREIETLENSSDLIDLNKALFDLITEKEQAINAVKSWMKERKLERDNLRKNNNLEINSAEFKILINQSSSDKKRLEEEKKIWNEKQQSIQLKLELINTNVLKLKELRNLKSNSLQQFLFEQYNFLNHFGEKANVIELFKPTVQKTPPAAAGDCALPKLLQNAYEIGAKPIAFGEFWWGKSPKSEIRKHKEFYPACTGKCKPILAHMLKGIDVEENPLEKEVILKEEPKILYQDDDILVVVKPSDLCSVPGKNQSISLVSYLEAKLKHEILVVHRLDMPTSGIMVFAKHKVAQQRLQKQFISKRVKKRYVAWLDGVIEESSGEINLPLGPDWYNLPFQMVDFKEGKPAITQFEVIAIKDGKTKVFFYPRTGRTHQLRMHSAHEKGLNAPIVGDDMYGKPDDRLYLHAEEIQFFHPTTQEWLVFEEKSKF